MARRDEIECWLTDMDGVLVHENRPVPGASELLAHWRRTRSSVVEALKAVPQGVRGDCAP